jgi:hypothetical protein
MFNAMGLTTGIDMPSLLAASRYLQDILPDTPMTSAVSRAGMPATFDFPDC